MNRKQRDTLTRAHEYSVKIGGHKPNLNTKYWKYRDALKLVGDIILANFGAWDKNNPYQEEDQTIITEAYKEIDKLIIDLDGE